MMKCKELKLLPVMAALGAVLLMLRIWLYAVAVDEKGLLISGHPLDLAVWAVAAVCLAVAVLAVLRHPQVSAPTVGTVAALGDVAFAVTIAVTVLSMEQPMTLVEKLRMAMGWLCVPGLGYTAYCRFRSKPVFFGGFAVVCVFFALYLVSSYQLWSSDPQLQNYVFAMLACVTLTVFAYQNAAFAVDMGNEKIWLAAGLLAVCFGIGAVQCSGNGVLMLGISLWAFTGLTALEKENGYDVAAQ